MGFNRRLVSSLSGALDPVEDCAKLALQGDCEIAARWAGSDDDAVYDLTDSFGRLRSVVGVVDCGAEALDPAPVGFRNAGVDVGNVLGRVRETGGKAVLFGFKLGQSVGQGAMPAAFFDDAHNLTNGFCRLSQFPAASLGGAAAVAVEPVGFLRIGSHGFRRHLRRHHSLAQAGEHSRFQNLAGDGSGIVTAVSKHMVGAGIAILPATGIGAATAAAEQQAGQKGARPMGGIEPAIPGKTALHALARCIDVPLVKCRQLVLPHLCRLP